MSSQAICEMDEHEDWTFRHHLHTTQTLLIYIKIIHKWTSKGYD